MTRVTAVFDFDKTLTDKDTLYGFYKIVAGNEWLFGLKRFLLLIAGVLYKTGLISNYSLKRVGVKLFIKNKSEHELETAARIYAEQIELNDIFFKYFRNTEGEKWIISASPVIYLQHLFPGENVAGSTFRYRKGKVIGLEKNMFGCEKKRFLDEMGIEYIGELYTDSMTDKPLMVISDKINLIKDGEIGAFDPKKIKE